MFSEISRHILDICRNSVTAEATVIALAIRLRENMLSVEIRDDGRGTDTVPQILRDPFYTTKKSGKTGLGIPLFRQAASAADGSFYAESCQGGGMCIRAEFDILSPDCMPWGNIGEDLSAVVLTDKKVDIVFEFESGSGNMYFDTRKVRRNSDGENMTVWKFIREYFRENSKMHEIGSFGKNFFRNKEENNEN